MFLILFASIVICESHSVLRLQRQAFQDDNLECINGQTYYIHPIDCRFFYRCLEHQNNDYQKFYTRCPRETIFSIEHATCIPGTIESCPNNGNYINKEKNKPNHVKVNTKIKCRPKHHIGKAKDSNINVYNRDSESNVNMLKQVTINDRNIKGNHIKNNKRIISKDEDDYTGNNGQPKPYVNILVNNNNHRNSVNKNKYNNQNDNNNNNNNNNKENIILSDSNKYPGNSIINFNKNDDYQYSNNDDQNDRFIQNKDNNSLSLIRTKDGENESDENSALNNENGFNGNNFQGSFNNKNTNFRDNIPLTQNYETNSAISKPPNKSNSMSIISSNLDMTGYLQNPISDSIYTNQSLLQLMAESLKLTKRKLPFTVELTGLESTGKSS